MNTLRYFLKCLFTKKINYIRLCCRYLEYAELQEIFDELVYFYSLTLKKEENYNFGEQEKKCSYFDILTKDKNSDPFAHLCRHICSYFLTVASQKKPNATKTLKKEVYSIKSYILEDRGNLKKFNTFKTLVMKKVLIISFRTTTEKKFCRVYDISEFKILNLTSEGKFNFGLLDEEFRAKFIKNLFLTPLHIRIKAAVLFIKTVVNDISSVGLGYKYIEDHYLTKNGLKLYEHLDDFGEFLELQEEESNSIRLKSENLSVMSDFEGFKELVQEFKFQDEKILFDM